MGLTTAMDLCARQDKTLIRITTGSSDLDTLLQGGIETNSLTELYGEFRTGKSQLCYTLCVTCMKPIEEGGAYTRSCYIDTEGSFRPARLRAIARRFNMDEEDVLNNVIVGRAYTSEMLLDMIVAIGAQMSEDPVRVRLDSRTRAF